MLDLVELPIGGTGRSGQLCVIPGGPGLVIFTHANGNNRGSRRSAELARRLHQRELSTLVFDLLSPEEAADRALPVDVDLLAGRILQAMDALPPELAGVPIGLFGSDTGAAAALVAETRRPRSVAAVVSRGGRPDLAGTALTQVRAPTLLIVGAADSEILELNRWAYAQLPCEKRIELVPRATHLFLEAGALDTVALRAGDWFCAHLRKRG